MAQHNGEDGIGTRPVPPQVSDTASQAVTGSYTIAIRRSGPSVEITLTSSSEYAGMELYDSLVQSVSRGSLRLELKS